jgi:hypothetical protein
MVALGYTITGLDEPSVQRPGVIRGSKTEPDGTTHGGHVVIRCSPTGATLQPAEDGMMPGNYEFSRAFGYSFRELVQRPDVGTPWKEVGLQVLVQELDPYESRLDLGDVATVGDAVPVRVTVRNNTNRAVRLDASRLGLVDASGNSHEALAGGALTSAIAPNAAGDKVKGQLFDKRPIRAGETRIGFLVYPPGKYKEARVSIDDVDTDESEGFVAPVE